MAEYGSALLQGLGQALVGRFRLADLAQAGPEAGQHRRAQAVVEFLGEQAFELGAGLVVAGLVEIEVRELVRGTLVEKTAEDQMKDRVLAHLFKPDPRAKLPISLSASLASSKADKFRIKVDVQVPIGKLALLPTQKGVSGAFSVFVAAVGPKGDFSEVSRKSQAFDIPTAEVEKATAGHYTYTFEIESSGPDARICVGVWDEKGGDAGFAVVRPSGPGS